MQAEGQWKRSHLCGLLDGDDAGANVALMGWVNRRRDHGGLIFIDLRDRTGLVQVVFSPEVDRESFHVGETLRNEHVLAVQGEVTLRPEGTRNMALATGDVEVYARKVEVLNRAKTPPFFLEDGIRTDENIRLQYRYLDLRRGEMAENLRIRHRAAHIVRDFLDSEGFLDVETPILTRSTPEGARDFLVPSRLHPGSFYALPQSPQLFKQLLMVSGIERYYQLARCFRDEDLRADRQPEFTQIDLEMSFSDQEELFDIIERLMERLFLEIWGRKIQRPFPRFSYQEALERFGSDKPDLRFGLEIQDITARVADCGFKVFQQTAAAGGVVRGIRVPGGHQAFTRRDLDELTEFVTQFGAQGLAWMRMTEEGVHSPVAKFFAGDDLLGLTEAMGGQTGDVLLFVAQRPQVAAEALGQLRLELARRLELIPRGELKFAWVVDFPLLEWDEEEQRYFAMHHPFTRPRDQDLDRLDSAPERVRAQAYDLVLNGVELGGGSQRIYRRALQERMFAALNLSPEEAREQFGFLLEALEFGAPPHGGIALGFDRLVMLLAGADNLREIIAFPKTASGTCLLTGAPTRVSRRQLNELQLRAMPREEETSREV